MKIIIYAGSCAKLNYSFIAPMRIARACARHGDEVIMINWANMTIPRKTLRIGKEKFPWGICYTLPLDDMIMQLDKTINSWKPDLVYSMGCTQIQHLVYLCDKYSIPLGIHGGDPYYARYPSESLMEQTKKADFITFNEGQAYNYVISKYPALKKKCYILNHAIDPELAPSLKELENTKKKYICSIVGGDDNIRRRELLLYFYQWTNKFPNYKFATGGSMTKGALHPYKKEDLIPKSNHWNTSTFTDKEVTKFTNKKFNLTYIPSDLTYPLGLSHPAVHKLYSESYYGFTPFGYYLREGWQSEFNMMTFGTKIFEMGGSGCAMIANKIKDIEKIIIQGETGLILNKPQDTYNAFRLAIKKPEEIKQMGINAYKFIHKYHSWDNRYKEVLFPIFKKLGLK